MGTVRLASHQICSGHRYGVVCRSLMVPRAAEHPPGDTSSWLAVPAVWPYPPQPQGSGSSVPGFLQLFLPFPPLPPPLRFYQLR